MCNRPRTASIHILDDDSLLHVFFLYRPFLLGDDQDEDAYLWGGDEGWDRGRWWYKIAHVCRRWRELILGSASYLELFIVCINGTPVADMLAHSPPLPLVIDYRSHDITTEDEEAIILALKQCNRVRRIRFDLSFTSLRKIIVAIAEEYPILEYMLIELQVEDNSTILRLPETLQAPRLRHLMLKGFALPIGSRLFTTAVSLVTLYLYMDRASTYFYPNTLLQWLLFMPQLETLLILFSSPVPNHEVERQLAQTPIITPITLPNLHRFTFQGVSTYLEALIHWITTPRLEKLEILFSHEVAFFVPRLLQFINTTENLKFGSAGFGFTDENFVSAFCLHEEFDMYAVSILVECEHLDWQVSSAAQIFNSLGQMFSAVEHITLEHQVHSQSSGEHNQVDRNEWRKLLSPFSNTKTLQIGDGLVEDLSRCLELEDGEGPLELLPKLQELTYFGRGGTDDVFTSFIDARQNADRPVSLVRRSPSPSPDPNSSLSIPQANNEGGSERDT